MEKSSNRETINGMLLLLFKQYKKTARELIKWYSVNQVETIDINKLWDYDPFIVIGLIKSFLFSKNIVWLFNHDFVLIRYANRDKDKTFINPNPIYIEYIVDSYEELNLDKAPIELAIDQLDINSSWLGNDVEVIEYVFNKHENPF